MRNIQFATDHFYHIYNRGVDKRITFLEDADYRRFYAGLYLLNDALYSAASGEYATKLSFVDAALQSLALDNQRQALVNIVSFCLMPNHFHMLLEQVQENGVSQFMHRLATAYTKYFNKRYERTGRLFEGPFKAVMVKRDGQLEHLPRYIHLNALDLTDFNWREGKIEDWDRAEKFLQEYPWSSHNMYLGKPQMLPVVEKSIFKQIFTAPDQYLKFLKQWSGRETPQSLAL